MNDHGARDTSFGMRYMVAVVLALVAGAVLVATLVSSPNDAGAKAKRFKPKGGNYAGKTAQKLSVTFKVKNGKVRKAEWSVRESSGYCRSILFQTSSGVKVNKKRKFSISHDSGSLTGKFVNKKKVKGKARVDFSTNPSCPSVVTTVKYTARHK